MRNITLFISLIFLAAIGNACQSSLEIRSEIETHEEFNAERAYKDIEYQVSLGSRTIGSEAHSKVADWIVNELRENNWETQTQSSDWNGNEVTNIIGDRGSEPPWIIIGAHYDSRFIADRDQDISKRDQPVPGANDGASGVSVLLELARVIPPNIDKHISLVFFDAEDNGNINGWEWIVGSKLYVQRLDQLPDAVVILDMIGDADLNIYKEKNSDTRLAEEIWNEAQKLGYSQFIHEYKNRMIDDHLPFIQASIPAVVLIDFDYPYWHTSEDTLDKVSPESLEVTGTTVLEWLNIKD